MPLVRYWAADASDVAVDLEDIHPKTFGSEVFHIEALGLGEALSDLRAAGIMGFGLGVF